MEQHESPEAAIAYMHRVGMNAIVATHLIPNLPKEVNNDATNGLSAVLKADTAHSNGEHPATVLHHLKLGAEKLTAAGSALMKHQDLLADHPYAPDGMLTDIANASGTGELDHAVNSYAELVN